MLLELDVEEFSDSCEDSDWLVDWLEVEWETSAGWNVGAGSSSGESGSGTWDWNISPA